MRNEAREKSRLVDPYLPPRLQPPTKCRRLKCIRNNAHVSYPALSWCRLSLLLILRPEHSRTVHDTLFLLDIEVYVLTFLLCVTHPAPPFECRWVTALPDRSPGGKIGLPRSPNTNNFITRTYFGFSPHTVSRYHSAQNCSDCISSSACWYS